MSDETIDRIDDLATHDRARSTVAETPSTLAAAAHGTVFEDEYQAIGWWKGPYATPAARARVRDFWRSSGEGGVQWLVRRLRDESHLETLHGVASLLADLGEVILGPVFEELARGCSGAPALGLLWALDSLSESAPTMRLEGRQAELALAGLLRDDDPDVREEAAQVLRLLGPERAVRCLEDRLRDETDAGVRQTIERELTRHRAGRS